MRVLLNITQVFVSFDGYVFLKYNKCQKMSNRTRRWGLLGLLGAIYWSFVGIMTDDKGNSNVFTVAPVFVILKHGNPSDY